MKKTKNVSFVKLLEAPLISKGLKDLSLSYA